MNIRMFFLITVVSVITFGMFACIADTDVLYQTGFESPGFSAGNVNGQDGWVVDSITGDISTSYVITAAQSLNVKRDIAGMTHKDFTAQAEFVTIEFKSKLSEQDKRSRIKVMNGSSLAIYVGYGSNNGGTYFANDGDGAGHTTTHEGLRDYTANVADTLKIIADIVNNTYDFYVNDNLLADNFGFWYNQTQLDRLFLEVPDSGTTLAIDDLVIDSTGTVYDDNNITSIITYQSSVSSDGGGPLDLKAELNYDNSRTNAPIAVVMHGYTPMFGNFDNIRANAQRLRDAGFFAVSVAMRGRDGSDGVRDSGGVEIYDIYDAAEYVKSAYASYVDPNHIHITGYSGGGGNTMAALTRFPDYFRLGSAYFGMSDYGYDHTNGWYFDGASSTHQAILRADIGNPTLGDPAIEDKYAAHASNLASQNNPHSEIHLFVNYNETTCPPVNDDTYRDNAIAHADFGGEFDNITIHTGGLGEYEDFNLNGVNESNELQSWPHGFPTANQQHAAEGWYLGRLLDGSIPQPVLNSSDEFHVGGFVKTKQFSLWLGDGQNAASKLDYSLSADLKSFELRILTNNQTVTGMLKVETPDMAGKTVVVKLNGVQVDEFSGGGLYTYNGLGHEDILELTVCNGLGYQAGDINKDCYVDIIDLKDLAYWWLNVFCSDLNLWCEGTDINESTTVDFVDFAMVAADWLE